MNGVLRTEEVVGKKNFYWFIISHNLIRLIWLIRPDTSSEPFGLKPPIFLMV